MGALHEEQREAVHELIAAGTAAAGHLRVVRIIGLELVLARIENDPELRPVLKKAGLLTRDSREKERKKPGLKRARKAPQYTKR